MSDILAAAGVLVAAGSAAAAILLPPGRARSALMLVALTLFPILILGDQWHSAQISDLRDDPARFIALGVAALAISAVLAVAFSRWPVVLPLAVVAVLPFRIPLHAGGDTANLLVPLYLVIAGGVLSAAIADWRGGGGIPPRELVSSPRPEPKRPSQSGFPRGGAPALLLPYVLAGVVLLYALQTLYSPDFSKSLQNVCFFFVPFSLVFVLLRDIAWTRRLLVLGLWVVAIEAAAFMLVGSVEYVSRSLFWNDQVIRSNEFHTYFRVNSIFWDPNIYGRYMALVIVLAMSALLWAREQRTSALLSGLIGIAWLGLVPTFSQSSFVALLAGLAVLAALHWSWRWALGAVGVVSVLAVLVVLFGGGISKLSPDRFNVETGGRANLVSGGAELFARRPLWGYGSGAFPRAYREHIATKKTPVSVSHTQPVTVAAEQGLIGLAAYGVLLAVALWTMLAGIVRTPGVARVAVLAAFVALLVHTMAYAGFFEDPITWVLLAMGTVLAGAAIRDAT